MGLKQAFNRDLNYVSLEHEAEVVTGLDLHVRGEV
jgi:hypothetical protein